MCGRFVLKAPFSELVRLYNVTNNVNLEPRYNIPPTEDIAVVRPDAGGSGRRLDMLRWGLVPYWAKDIKIGYSLIIAKCVSKSLSSNSVSARKLPEPQA